MARKILILIPKRPINFEIPNIDLSERQYRTSLVRITRRSGKQGALKFNEEVKHIVENFL